MGQDSSVGIVTCYRQDGPGIKSWWGAKFSVPFQTGPGADPASYKMGTGSFLGLKWPGCGIDHPPPYSNGKGVLLQARCGPEGSRRFRLPDFMPFGM